MATGELWYPGAIRHNGAHVNYAAGRVGWLESVVCHYTVGVNSIGTLGRDFQFLVDRDGDIHQGCPIDAVCWHAGSPWNWRGPGIEAEYHWLYDDVNGDGPDDGDILTDAQVESLEGLVHWIASEHGVPLAYHDGDRLTDWYGFISHRSVIQTGDWHNDYWPGFDWDDIIDVDDQVASEARTPNSMDAIYSGNLDGTSRMLVKSGDFVIVDVTGVAGLYGIPWDALNYINFSLESCTVKLVQPATTETAAAISERLVNPPAPVVVTTDGASPEQIAHAVRDVFTTDPLR